MLPSSICIATPAYEGQCTVRYAESLVHLCLVLSRKNVGLHYVTAQGSFVSAARNHAANYFLNQTAATHLLFIDGDMAWRTEDMLRLLEHGDRDIVAALCPRKRYDWARIAEAARAHPDMDPDRLPLHGAEIIGLPPGPLPDAPIEVDFAGAGIMLIRRDVFERLAAAHPDWALSEGLSAGGFSFFAGGRDPDAGFLGEDHAFCQDARRAGARIHVCPWLRVGHVGSHEFVGWPIRTADD
jgi:hypothetical protein